MERIKSPKDNTEVKVNGSLFDKNKITKIRKNPDKNDYPFGLIENDTEIPDTINLSKRKKSPIKRKKSPIKRKKSPIINERKKSPIINERKKSPIINEKVNIKVPEKINYSNPPKLEKYIFDGEDFKPKAHKPIIKDIPDFSNYTDMERIRIRLEYDSKFVLLRKQLIGIDIPHMPMETSLETIALMFIKYRETLTNQSFLRKYKYALALFLIFCEFGLTQLGLKAGGLSKYIWKSINAYDEIFIEFGENDIFSISSGWSPLTRLMFMLGIQILFFIGVKYISKGNAIIENLIYIFKDNIFEGESETSTDDNNINTFFSAASSFNGSNETKEKKKKGPVYKN